MADKDPFARLNPFRKIKTEAFPGQAIVTRPATPSNAPAWNPAAASQASTPPPINSQWLTMPKSPIGHPIPLSEKAVNSQRKQNEESPLFRRSLIGRRPDSPTELTTGGLPEDMKIPHGLENPGVKKDKGIDGLKDENLTVDDTLKKLFGRGGPHVTLSDGDAIMSDDGDDEWVDEETGDKPKVVLDHAIMSSPIICLLLDHPDKSGHCERVTFQVHRALLAGSNLLSACLGPDTTEIVLNYRLKPYAVSAVIQFLYSGDFTLEDKFQTVEDEEGYFEKLTTVEWTCCYLGVFGARELTLMRIESSYSGFEFRINAAGMAMRIKMTEWVYGVDEQFISPGGKIQQLRQRVLGGWCRDLSLIHQDNVLNETFENLLVDYPTLSFDLRQFLVDRAQEESRMKTRLAAFERAELRGKQRYERQRNLLFPRAARHASRPRLPTLVLPNPAPSVDSQHPVETPGEAMSIDLDAGPPVRKKATRISDAGEGLAEIRASKFILKTP
ncbi:hypothetical protein Dda_4329 [Drechslerella dactyloides]|uniref:BTB domain-containing protein n=1 Tax=Drechslerella dactyloides TaxID=74499 RepID=A0AAD6NKH5_DREDA|nr:hypothetical protein Dda_4329 [Drechslerella dactyloides]